MRNWLLAATAAAPLAFAASLAHAVDTISSNTSTPAATATATSTGPADIDLKSGTTLTVSGTTPGLTLNSNNNITIEGTISSSNVVSNTGVALTGGFTGSFTNTGSISLTESYTATDSVNSDSVVEAPFAKGTTAIGVHLLPGTAALVGDVLLEGTGISIKGVNSYGALLEAPIQGLLTVSGPIALTGDNGVALKTTGSISGAVAISGAVTASGMNSQGVSLGGDIGGSATFTSSITASGYSQTSRSTTDPAQTKLQATPTDVEQGGTALTILGSVKGGVLFSGVPTGTVSGTTADVNGDGIADGSETTSSVISYGKASAIQIGGGALNTTIGAFGTGQNAYGLLFFGTVTGAGIYDGVTANALTIGGSGGGTVTVTGGARNSGTISSTAYEADSTAIHLMAGANLATLYNQGTIDALVDHSTLVSTPTAHTATAISIDQGATLSAIFNTGVIEAGVTGDPSSSVAVVDRSGTLAKVTNEGVIEALVTAVTSGDTLTGSTTALDLRNNTTGVTLLQQTNPSPDTTYGSKSGDATTTTTTTTATVPEIVGDIFLGNGANTVTLLAGGVAGALSLGTGVDSFTIDGGAGYQGALTYGGSALKLAIGYGTLVDTSTSTLKLSSLSVGATGEIVVAVDPANSAATLLQVSGAATIAAGGKIGATLLSTVTSAQNFTLLTSPTLSTSGADSSLLGSSSYLYASSFSTVTSGAVSSLILNIQPKTAAQLGLDKSEAAALTAVLTGVTGNVTIERALLAPTTKAGFLKIYDQLLPDHGGGVFLAAEEASEAIVRNTNDHIDMHDPGAAQAWAKEFTLGGIQTKQTGDASHNGGFGFVGGLATSEGPLGALGITAAFVDTTTTDPELSISTASTFSELESGIYWSAEAGGLRLSARAGGGYLFGVTHRLFQSAATAADSAISLTTKAAWNGWTASGQLFGSYQYDFGRWFIRPQAHVDYFTMSQDAQTDKYGGTGFDLVVNSRSGYEASGSASLVFGAHWGTAVVWRPNIELGVREVFSGTAGDTTAAFAGGGSAFTLTANPVTGLGGVARIGLKADGELYEISIDAQAQNYAHYYEGDVGVTVRFHF